MHELRECECDYKLEYGYVLCVSMALLFDLVEHVAPCPELILNPISKNARICRPYNNTIRSMLLTVTSQKQGPDGHAVLPTATIAGAYLYAAYDCIGYGS